MKTRVKGFTAIEMTVAIGLMSVLVLLCCGLMTLSENLTYRNAQLSTDKFSADSVYSLITDKLIYARNMTIASAPLDNMDGKCVLSIEDGKLYLDGEDVYGDSFYCGSTIELQTSVMDAEKGLLSLEIRVLDENGEQQYSKGSVITVLNIPKKGDRIQSSGGTSLVNPYIYFDLYGFTDETETTTAETTVTTTTTTVTTTTTTAVTEAPADGTEFTFTLRPLSGGYDSTNYTLKAIGNADKSAWTICTISNIPQMEIVFSNIGSFSVTSWTNCSGSMANDRDLTVTMNTNAENFLITLSCAAQTTPALGDGAYRRLDEASITTTTTAPVTQPPAVQETVLSLATNSFSYQYWRPQIALIGEVWATTAVTLTHEQLLNASYLNMTYTAQNIHNEKEKLAFIFNVERKPAVEGETNYWAFFTAETALYYAPMVESGTLSMPISILLEHVPENAYVSLIGLLPMGEEGNSEQTTINITKLALT